MITNTPLQLCVLWASILSWINISSPLILFGLYYGFLTTLPIGPSQILSIRAFLLEGNLSGTIALSGLILGQLIIFLSIYYSPFYIILIKPHTITLLVLPYILFYWYRIKDLLDYQSLRPVNSINDSRIYKVFFDSFIFQLLNPVLLPNPVLARLVNLFFFRYSNNFLFVLSCFFGWLSGHFFFFNFIKLLLVRIEQDSPVLYLLVKRLIYRTFSIFILAYFLLYLGRAPIPIFTKKLNDEFQFNQQFRFSWLNKPWPTFFFDHRRWNRPLRYIENSRFSNKGPVKKKVSQYFFDISINDGNQKISFTALPSLSIFEKDLRNYLNISKKSILCNNFYTDWIDSKKKRKDNLYSELKNRLKALDNGFFIKDVIEKKTGLSNSEGNNLTKNYDPFLNGLFRGKTIISKSPWLLIENIYELKKNKKIPYLSKKENKLKFWISNQWRDLERKNLPLPWEPLNKDARRILILLIRGSKNKKLEMKLQQINFSEEQALINSNKQKTFSDLITKSDNNFFLKKKLTKTSYFNWELVLNLSTRQRTLYFKRLEQEKWQILERSWKNLWLNYLSNANQLNKIIFLLKKIFYFNKKLRLQEISKEIPRWTAKLRNDKFDVIAGGVTDIRQRKVKNLGYLIKGKDKRRKIIRRFSQQSDFRRKLVKGSMRARRRKTLIWKILQLKIHSPFFLRINEKHIPFKFSLNKFNLISIKNIFKNPIEKRKQITSFSTGNNISTNIRTKKTKADRLAIANRWDFPLAQWGRSWLLIIQSHFRKYLILPILIIVKNIIRFILFQTPEWSEDWYEWKKEIYIKCTYDGTEVSEKELPEQWLRDGLQIKIIYPFNLKPWHSVRFETNKEKNILNNEEKISNNLLNAKKYFAKNRKKINYSYLTAWGFQTNVPFGDIKKKPSFWKLIRKELIKRWKKIILLKLNKIYFNFLILNKKITINFFNTKSIDEKWGKKIKLDTKIKNNYELLLNLDKTNKKLKEPIVSKFNENLLSENQIKKKSKILINIQKLKNLKDLKKYKINEITEKNCFDKIEFSNKLENENRIYVNNKNNKKKIIEIRYQIRKYYKKNIEGIKKNLYFIKIELNKINKNVLNLYIYFIRFNINLILKIRKNLIKKNWNLSKNYKINYEKNKINYEYRNYFNQENILLMSQAYLFHKIWQTKKINKYNFKDLLKNWSLNLLLKKKIENNLKKNEIFPIIKFENLKEKFLRKLLQKFNRYNISSQIWYRIIPKEWKNKVNHQWIKKRETHFKISEKQTKISILSKKKNFSYKLVTNYLLEQNRKLNKQYQYNYLCYSYLDFEKIPNFIKLSKYKEALFNEKISETLKDKKNIYIKSNLVLLLIPPFMEKKNIAKIEKINILKMSLLKQKNKKNIQNKKLLRERERHQTIRQWKWKSKNVEKKFKELGDMASLMTFMQDQENIISLSAKMRENLNLFRLLFCRDIGINKLTINSEHRIPRVLDDEILMYKVVSVFFKSKIRLKKKLNFKNLNESTSRTDFFQDNIKTSFELINLEDIMLSRHRKELKVLNFLYLNKKKIFNLDKYFVKKNGENLVKLHKFENENKNLTIKHFLWPSFRLEDLACVNRFWFNTNNGSRFTMLRIRMYT